MNPYNLARLPTSSMLKRLLESLAKTKELSFGNLPNSGS